MIKIFDITNDDDKNQLKVIFQKAVQSCNLNFLIGSGCSYPAIQVLGNIENEIEILNQEGKTEEVKKKINDFLIPFINCTKTLIEKSIDELLNIEVIDDISKTLYNYYNFINTIISILFERKSNILHKQANIFTTNYDLFIEKIVEKYEDILILSDGFCRNSLLNNEFIFSSKNFFNKYYNIGNLYKYQVELPSINLIKLHGSLNWQIKNNKIYHSVDFFNNQDPSMEDLFDYFNVILPQKTKFHETVLNHTYYDLLRIFSNELDKENTLLIAEGFSFADEHIYDLMKRALKNPTLRLIVFCFKEDELNVYQHKFEAFNNVNIIYSKTENIDFKLFINLLIELLPINQTQVLYNNISGV